MPRARSIVYAVIAVLLAALLLPFLVNVNRYRFRVASELEARLGRPVQVRDIRLKLLSGPGFDLRGVTIGEDPAFGIEPVARVPLLRATLRLRSLWTGRLAFSSLVLEDASVNVTRNAEGRWNLAGLLDRASRRSRAAGEAPPYLELQAARINFKSGYTKSVFFLSGVDAALWASGPGARLNLRLTGAPARTDRMLTDVGLLRLDGAFLLPAAPHGTPGMRLNVDLSDAYLSDLLMLWSGSDYGVHGQVRMRAALEGEPAALRASGTLKLSDLHRWDMLPPEPAVSLDVNFDSVLNAPAGTADLRVLRAELGAGALEGSGHIENLLARPRARFRLNFSGARAGPVVAALRHFSSNVSPAMVAEGLLDGELDVDGPPVRVKGFVIGRHMALHAPGLAGAHARDARLDFDSSLVSLQPMALSLGDGRTATVSGAWDWETGRGRVSCAARDLPLAAFDALAGVAGVEAIPPGLARLPETRVAAAVHAELLRGAPRRVTGWAQVARASWSPPGVRSPVVLHAARLDFLVDQLRVSRLVAGFGGTTITGSLRIPLRGNAPYWADLRASELNLSGIAAALRPPRGRSAEPVVTAAARLGEREKPQPWAEGRLAVGRLVARKLEMEGVSAAFRIAGRQLSIDQSRAKFAGGTWQGSARVDFSGREPAIDIAGTLEAASLGRVAALVPPFEGLAEGRVNAAVRLASSGWESPDLVANLTMKLKIDGRDLLLKNIDLEAAASGEAQPPGATRITSYNAEVVVARRKVVLEHAVLQTAAARFSAAGSVAFDRSTAIEILPDSGNVPRRLLRAFRLTGPIESPHAEVIQEARKNAGGG